MSPPRAARSASLDSARLTIVIGGRTLSAAELSAVTEVFIRCALGVPSQCEVALRVDAIPGSSDLDPQCGDVMHVGLADRPEALFVGDVTVLEQEYRADSGHLRRIRGYDPLHRLRKRRFVRVHEDTDLAGLARTLAGDTGLAIEAPGEALGDVYQLGVSDLDVLTDRAARVGRYPVVDGGALRLVTLAAPPAEVELVYGRTLHSATIEVSGEPAYDSIELTPWDPGDAVAAPVSAQSSSAGPRVSGRPTLASVGGGGAGQRLDDPIASADGSQASSLAQAHLDVLHARTVSATLVCEGDPALSPGRSVRVSGLDQRLEGTYLITSCTHRIDATGFTTEIDTRPPDGPRPRLADRLTLGVVEQVDDPQGRARVRVSLAAYPGLQTSWAPVVTAAAGHDKGIVAQPAPGDTVLVLLLAGDPAHAVVLGGLYGQLPAPLAQSPAPHEQIVVRTVGGTQLTLDGADHRITLTDGLGSTVELGPDLLRISAATDVLLEAVGKAMRIRARSVDFEEAP